MHEITADPILLARAAALAAGGGYEWKNSMHWRLERPPARLLVDAGADLDELRRAMRVVWARRNDKVTAHRRPPLTDAELDAIMADLAGD